MSPESFKVYQTEGTNYEVPTNGAWLTCREEGQIVTKPDQQGIPSEIFQKIKSGHIGLGTGRSHATDPYALVACEVKTFYCILAIATTSQTGNVYYRYFWLSLDDFDQQTDGILTLCFFCQENNWPTYERKPDDVEWKLPKEWPINKISLEEPDVKNWSGGIDVQMRPFLTGNDVYWLYLHFAALKLSQNTPLPIAWAWNVRELRDPNRFLAISCADESSYQRLSQRLNRASQTTYENEKQEHKDRFISTSHESNPTQESDGENWSQPDTSPSPVQSPLPVTHHPPQSMVNGQLVNNQSSNYRLEVHEFCRGFIATQKDGIWVSGGFKSNKIDRPSRSVPKVIEKAVTDGWLKIPDDDFPLPGAVALLEQETAAQGGQRGNILVKPPFESIAVIAREIDRYCILAIATTYLDNTPGMRQMVSYQYYWLSLDELQAANPDPERQVDGILSLIDWWLENGYPCFNMDPNRQHSYPYRPRIHYKNLSPNDLDTLLGINNFETDPNLSPPILLHPTILLHPNSLAPSRRESIYLIHRVALQVVELYDIPLAWAWNVRNLTAPAEFAAIQTADSNALDRLVSKKQKLPKKSRFVDPPPEEPLPTDGQSSRSDSTRKPSTPSGTPTHPDPLFFERLDRAITKYTTTTCARQNHGALLYESIVFHQFFLRLLESLKHRFIPEIYNNPHVLALKEVLDIYRNSHSQQDSNWHVFYASKLEKLGGYPGVDKYLRSRYYLILFTLLLVNVRSSPPDLPEGAQNYWDTLRVLLSEHQPYKSSVVEYLKNLEQAAHSLEKQPEYQSICESLKARIYQLLHAKNDKITSPPTSRSDDSLVPIILLIKILASIIITVIVTVPLFLSQRKACSDAQDNRLEIYMEELIKQKKISIPIKGECRPNEPITRADLTSWLKATFPDFDAALLTGEQSPVSRIEALEIISRNVTRTKRYQNQEAISKLLSVIYFGSDFTNISEKEKELIRLVAQQGLIINYPNPCLFKPKDNATRAEVAAMLYFSKNPTAIPSYPSLNFQQLLCYGLQLEVSERDTNQARQKLQKQLQGDVFSSQFMAILIPDNLKQKQLEALPTLEPGMKGDIIFSLKNMFFNFPYKQRSEHLSYPVYTGEINNEFDTDLEKYIKELQSLGNIKPTTGNIGLQTWQELSEYFPLVNAEEAKQHLVNGLQSNASLVDLIKELRNCQVQGPLKYEKCLEQKTSSRNSQKK